MMDEIHFNIKKFPGKTWVQNSNLSGFNFNRETENYIRSSIAAPIASVPNNMSTGVVAFAISLVR